MSAGRADRAFKTAALRTATQDSLLLKEVLQSINAQSCPTIYNFHMHTLCSDGKLSPSELMTQAVEIGLKGMAITDHHSVKGYRQACKWMEDWRWHNPSSWSRRRQGNKKSLPKLWSGVEITSSLANTDVHILGYAFNVHHKAMKPYLQG
ncbi:MAG: PHP domain-containing protein, partial [Cyanobacteria bacterium J06649_4]